MKAKNEARRKRKKKKKLQEAHAEQLEQDDTFFYCRIYLRWAPYGVAREQMGMAYGDEIE